MLVCCCCRCRRPISLLSFPFLLPFLLSTRHQYNPIQSVFPPYSRSFDNITVHYNASSSLRAIASIDSWHRIPLHTTYLSTYLPTLSHFLCSCVYSCLCMCACSCSACLFFLSISSHSYRIGNQPIRICVCVCVCLCVFSFCSHVYNLNRL